MPDSTWFSGMLCCLDYLEPYHPDRVLRQFGRVQCIPGRPYMSASMAKKAKPGQTSTYAFVPFNGRFSDRWEDCCLDEESRSSLIVDGEPATTAGYMEWYRERSVTRLSAVPVARPAPPARAHAYPSHEARTAPPHDREIQILEMVRATLTDIRHLDIHDAHSTMLATLKRIEAMFDAPSSSSPPASSSVAPSLSPTRASPPPPPPTGSPPPPQSVSRQPPSGSPPQPPPPVKKVYTAKGKGKKSKE